MKPTTIHEVFLNDAGQPVAVASFDLGADTYTLLPVGRSCDDLHEPTQVVTAAKLRALGVEVSS